MLILTEVISDDIITQLFDVERVDSSLLSNKDVIKLKSKAWHIGM